MMLFIIIIETDIIIINFCSSRRDNLGRTIGALKGGLKWTPSGISSGGYELLRSVIMAKNDGCLKSDSGIGWSATG